MNWNKSFFLVIFLVGITVLAMVGCSKSEESGTTTPAPSNSTNVTTPLPPSGTRPMPPEGSLSDNTSRPRPVLDFAAAAAKLGVTEQQLREALGDQTQGPADMAAAAKKLGVTEQSLREALGFPAGNPPAGNPPGGAKPGGQGQ